MKPVDENGEVGVFKAEADGKHELEGECTRGNEFSSPQK